MSSLLRDLKKLGVVFKDCVTTGFSTVKDTISGNLIATHVNELGQQIPINESITSMVLVGDDLTYVNETGVPFTIDLSSYINRARIVSGSYSAGLLSLVRDDGSSVSINLSGLGNSVVSGTVAGHSIATHTSSSGVVVSINETVTTMTALGNTISYTNEQGIVFNHTFTENPTIVSASYDSITGVLTLTNDDSSTVTVTIGSLNPSVISDTVSGHKIFTHTSGDATVTDVFETITSIALVGSELRYVDEDGSLTALDLTGLSETIELSRIVSGSIDGNTLTLVRDDDTTITIDLGGVIPAISTITDTITGHQIGIHNDGLGNLVPINESVTSLSVTGNELSFTNELGNVVTVTLPQSRARITSGTYSGGILTLVRDDLTEILIPITVSVTPSNVTDTIAGHQIAIHTNGDNVSVPIRETITDMSISGNSLLYTREDGSVANIDLSGLLDNTNLPRIISGTYSSGTLTLTRDDATTISIVLTGLGNSVISNTVSGHRILTHTNGAGVAIDVNETVTSLVLSGSNLIYTAEDGSVSAIDVNVATGGTRPRIDSASYDSITGQLTLTRDDLSTVVTILDIAYPTVTDTVTGHAIATYTAPGETPVVINETITLIGLSGTILQYTDEAGVLNSIDLSTLSENINLSRIVSGSVDTVNDTLTLVRDDASTIVIDLNGLLPTTSVFSNLISGHRIGTHYDGLGTTVDLNETITNLSLSGSTLTFSKEDGTTNVIDLTTILRARITSGSYAANTITLTRDDATTISIPLTGLGNSTLSNVVSGHRIFTHTNGAGLATDVNETVTSMTFAGNILVYNKENGLQDTADFSSLVNRPRIVSGSLSSTTLNLVRDDTSTVSIDVSALAAPSVVTNLNTAADKKTIANHTSSTGVSTPIQETVTALSYLGTILSYRDENSVVTSINLSGLQQARITSGAVTGGNIVLTRSDSSTVSFPFPSSVYSGQTTGHIIGTHTSGTGAINSIRETITTLSFAGSTLTYTDEAGVANTVSLSSLNRARINAGSYASNVLTLTREDSTTINIPLPSSLITNLVTGHRIFTHTSGSGTITDVNETVTSLASDIPNNRLLYTREDGLVQQVTLPTFSQARITSGSFSGSTLTLTRNDATTIPINLSALITQPSLMSSTLSTGNVIGVHNNQAGQITTIRETITSLELAGTDLNYKDETGTTNAVSLTSVLGNQVIGIDTAGTNNKDLVLSMQSGSTLTLPGAFGTWTNLTTGHRIGTYSRRVGTASLYTADIFETVTSLSLAGNILTYVNENGAETNLTLPTGGGGGGGGSTASDALNIFTSASVTLIASMTSIFTECFTTPATLNINGTGASEGWTVDVANNTRGPVTIIISGGTMYDVGSSSTLGSLVSPAGSWTRAFYNDGVWYIKTL